MGIRRVVRLVVVFMGLVSLGIFQTLELKLKSRLELLVELIIRMNTDGMQNVYMIQEATTDGRECIKTRPKH